MNAKSKQAAAEAIIYSLGRHERERAARVFVDTTGRRMTDDEIIGCKEYSDLAGWSFYEGAKRLASHVIEREQIEAKQGSLL